MYKRRGEWEKAVALWEKAAEHGDVGACIELAKYYEHKMGDYEKALAVTTIAIESIEISGGTVYQIKMLVEETQHRIDRLQSLIDK
jgi:TPR repeat protein